MRGSCYASWYLPLRSIMSRLFCVFVILSLPYGICGLAFKQERAKVLFANPKYVKDVTIFTFREKRHSPYLTTLNVTTMVPLGDNVTIRLEFVNSKLQAFPMRLDIKICEGFKTKWSRDWLQEYSDIPLECPIQPGKYHVIRFELPPKNFPFQLNNVDYSGRTTIFVTGTKEKICDFSIELKSDRKSEG